MKANIKRLFAAAAFALVGTGAFAQTSQGTYVVSGAVGVSTYTNKYENNQYSASEGEASRLSFSFSPSLGYMIKDNLQLGSTLHLSHSISKSENQGYNNHSSSKTVYNTIGLHPYLQKFFMLSDKVALTGALSSGIYLSNQRTEGAEGNDTEFTRRGFDMGITPGIYFFPNEKIGLSASIGYLNYSRNTSKPKDGEGYKDVDSNFGFDLRSYTSGLSFSYFISR